MNIVDKYIDENFETDFFQITLCSLFPKGKILSQGRDSVLIYHNIGRDCVAVSVNGENETHYKKERFIDGEYWVEQY